MRGTLYENTTNTPSACSLVVEIDDAAWSAASEATLPHAIKALVVEKPTIGLAQDIYAALTVGTSTVGPVVVKRDDHRTAGPHAPLHPGAALIIYILGSDF